MRIVTALNELAADYDVLLCDIWGVIHNGVTADQGACSALARWAAKRGPVVLISNSPRPSPEVVLQLDALEVPRAAWSAIVTSGDATRVLLAQRAPGPAFRIGPGRDDPLYAGLGLDFAPISEAVFIACSGPDDDEAETPEDYRQALAIGVSLNLEMICANPDIVVQRGDRLIYCGGALARLYRELGGVTIMAGKPHSPIYNLALAKARELLGAPLHSGRVLAIGDGLETDVAGANMHNLDVLFIANGIHGGPDMIENGALKEEALERLLAQDGLIARFAMAALT